MSLLADNEPDAKRAKPTKPRVKRRMALLHGYRGAGYYGSSRTGNRQFRTIDDELEDALVKAEAIAPSNQGELRKIGFSRCARTDKGVSALANVITAKLLVSPEQETIEGRQGFVDSINSFLPPHVRVWAAIKTTQSFNAKKLVDSRSYEYLAPLYIFGSKNDDVAELLANLNDTLSEFIGTHTFHNFTSGKKPTDPSSKRYIMAFEVPKTVEVDDVTFVLFRIKGQSFMIHQIRKMIGLVIRIARDGRFSQRGEIVRGALSQSVFPLPMAPALGLFLRECHYAQYNAKFGGERESLKIGEQAEIMEQWAKEFVFKDISKKERQQQDFRSWCDSTDEYPVPYDDMIGVGATDERLTIKF